MTDFSTLLTLTEEPLKSKIAQLFFGKFTYQGSKIDFIITQKHKTLGELNLLWAEAKDGDKGSLDASFIQLILTIGKHRFHTHQTPNFLGAFDGEKFAFLPFGEVQKVFVQNDIDWSVTPSNHKTQQFQTLLNSLESTLAKKQIFYYERDEKELKDFIAKNLNSDHISKYQIDKNNFFNIYLKWREAVRDTISIEWDKAKTANILDADFYLADLLSDQDKTIVEKLNTILDGDHYKMKKGINFFGALENDEAFFKDSQKAHKQFWSLYERPPRKEFWDYIIERRDLLVPQDIRERKGAFFTPSIWVAQSQAYLAKALGEDWQDEYYIWDCAGGTGNLLAGLTNARNIFCSTLDKSDIAIMHERIANGANLLENHIFQFDFLNDEFFDQKDSQGNIVESKLPKPLQAILKDEKKRQKLIVYINPPYAEAPNARQIAGTGKNKSFVARGNFVSRYYQEILGRANNELFAQFFIRIYKEISGCVLASFSTLKYLNSQNFIRFRESFKARFLGGFITPADTFDNVKGKFPIGFLIWDTKHKEKLKETKLDIFDKGGQFLGQKNFYAENPPSLNQWVKKFQSKDKEAIALIVSAAPDFQHQQQVALLTKAQKRYCFKCDEKNLLSSCTYFAVRHALPHTWINHNDQFLYPKSQWQDDAEFQSDCLAFTLFHRKNRITGRDGINHFIPFSEKEVKAKSAFASNFMEHFITGKSSLNTALFSDGAIVFSQEAQAVLDAGRELFTYYHTYPFSLYQTYYANASLYDIKEFFQGHNKRGELNHPGESKDSYYKDLLAALTEALDTLAKRLEPKIYEYGFLRE